MFAALNLERDPLAFQDLFPHNTSAGMEVGMGVSWLQIAGGFATIVLGLWLIFQALQKWFGSGQATDPRYQRLRRILIICFLCAIFGYMVFGGAKAAEAAISSRAGASATNVVSERIRKLALVGDVSSAVAGAFSLFAISFPLLFDLVQSRIKARRIWALARLSMKEAIRRKVLWVFMSILVVFLFGSWFMDYGAPQDQVRTYVQVLYWAMTFLLLLTAALLAAFSIPSDVKNQTIHTILTKPVERFEIVLGRFLGYTLIMTGVLIVMTALSLGYLIRGINEDAKAESLKARMPLYGQLSYEGTKNPEKGTNVGKEWDYRGYIIGPTPGAPTEYAVWSFDQIPSELASRDQVRCEYTFDIYRTHKGVENEGVKCTFIVQTWRADDPDVARSNFQKEMTEAEKDPSFNRRETENKLAEKYGFFELPSRNVVDFHTLALDIPGGLFKNALETDSAQRKQVQAQGQKPPLVRVRVRCDDPVQYVGVAKRDLYFRVDDPNSQWNTLWFAWNFFKGSFGLWLRLCLVIGMSITFSTYLSGVISFLLMAFLYVGGLFQDYIHSLTMQTAGPMESFIRVVSRENSVTPLEETTQNIATLYDEPFRWLLRRVLNILPDVDRFDLSTFVSEGFNISATDLILNSLLVIGFLVPLAILAYHLLRWREVASAT